MQIQQRAGGSHTWDIRLWHEMSALYHIDAALPSQEEQEEPLADDKPFVGVELVVGGKELVVGGKELVVGGKELVVGGKELVVEGKELVVGGKERVVGLVDQLE